MGILLFFLYLRVLAFLPPREEVLPLRPMSERSVQAAVDGAEGLLDLNAATLEDLKALPGIGEKTAAAILEKREELGRFRYPEDLLLVSGIGEGKLNAIYDLICVRQTE